MTDLFSKETITLDDLREQFRRNDFTTMPVADKRKYNPDEIEIHSYISGLMDEKWHENAKTMGQKHPSSCYSGDFPTELLRDRLEGIVADNVIAILNDETALNNIMESIVNPALEKGVDGDECLDNTVNTLMKTVDFETMLKLSEEFTADSDFNENKAQNFPKIDHDRKWNHSRSKIKTVSYEGLNREIEKLNFISDNTVLSKYLNSSSSSIRSENDCIIFPFGCNASQIAAVRNALANQISVIEGPPGTGKTQTILNIIANIVMHGYTVAVASNNNSATDNVFEKLQKYHYVYIIESAFSKHKEVMI